MANLEQTKTSLVINFSNHSQDEKNYSKKSFEYVCNLLVLDICNTCVLNENSFQGMDHENGNFGE